MMNLLFSPSGRINSAEFMRGAYILIGLGVVLALLPLISMQLAMIFGLLGLVLYYCWIVLWIKRYHDAGKSGWMCLIPIIVFLVLGGIVGALVQSMMGVAADPAEMGSDIGSIMKYMQSQSKDLAVPNAVSTAVVSFLIAFLFNKMIKGEPNENRFGPAT